MSLKAPAAFLCVLCLMSGCVIVERSTFTWSKSKALKTALPLAAIDDGERMEPIVIDWPSPSSSNAALCVRSDPGRSLPGALGFEADQGHMTWISCPPGAKISVGTDLTPERSWVSFRASGSLRLLLQATESEQADACRVILALH